MSVVPAVKAAIIERLKASDALAGVPIVRGKPADPAPQEYVSLWKAKGNRNFAGLRGGASTPPLDEVVELTIVVDVKLASGSDFAPADIRAYEIFAAVDAVLRADLTLGEVWRFDHTSSFEDDFYRDEKRRGCRIFQTLSGKARI